MKPVTLVIEKDAKEPIYRLMINECTIKIMHNEWSARDYTSTIELAFAAAGIKTKLDREIQIK